MIGPWQGSDGDGWDVGHMTIREAVARAIYEAYWYGIEGFKGDPYYGSGADLWKNWLPAADLAIAAFLEATAEQGWHMRPENPTREMNERGSPVMNDMGQLYAEACYRAMNAAAPPFELDK